jgi:predicted DNA-binding transcriptional regulator AlpA
VQAANDNTPKYSALPFGVAPRGLSRAAAAEWVNVGTTTFDEMVKDGRMPAPRLANSKLIWDRYEVDEAFSALPRRPAANPWDD